MSKRPRRPNQPTTTNLQSTQLQIKVQISPFDFTISRQRISRNNGGQQSQAYNGLPSRQSLPSCGTTRHRCSQRKALTPFRHVRAPLLGQILPRQSVTSLRMSLYSPLFHVGRNEYRDFLQHHHLSCREPLCYHNHHTLHPLDFDRTSSRLRVVVSFFFGTEPCSGRSIPTRVLRLTHEFFEVFVQIHRLACVTL